MQNGLSFFSVLNLKGFLSKNKRSYRNFDEILGHKSLINKNKKNFRYPPNTKIFNEIFYYIWNHGLGNELNKIGDPVPWTAESLEAAFESVHRNVDKRAIQNWRSGRNLPSRKNIHSLARIVSGDDEERKIAWSDALIESISLQKNQSAKKAVPRKSEKPVTNVETPQIGLSDVATKELTPIWLQYKAFASIGVILVMALAIFLTTSSGLFQKVSPSVTTTSNQLDVEKSLAIFPFKVFSTNPDVQYLSEGIAEETLHGLSQVVDIKLASRRAVASLDKQSLSPEAIKAALGVDYILDGSVRSEGQRLRVYVQLIKASDGSIYWSETFDNLDASIFDMQEKISRGIVAALDIHLSPEERDRMFNFGTRNVQAYAHYLKGRHLLKYWHETKENDDIWKALSELEAAVAEDPQMSKAWFHMADPYYHFAAGHIARPDNELNIELPSTPAEAAKRIDFVLTRAEETANNETDKYQARLNRIFFSDDWSELREATLTFSDLASKERGELEWEFGPVSLVLLSEGDAIRDLMDNRVLKYDPENGTAHAYIIRQYLAENKYSDAEARLENAKVSSFSSRIDEVQGYMYFARNDIQGLNSLLRNSQSLSPLLKDYFSALVSYKNGDVEKAHTLLNTSKSLEQEKIHLALAWYHIGETEKSQELLNAIAEEPLGTTLLSVIISYGAACGPKALPKLERLDKRLAFAEIKPLPCTSHSKI